jgi:aspartate/glutamate racemase
MHQKTLVIIHTGPVTVQPLNALAPSLLPGVRVVNLVDDSLLKDAMAAGHVTPAVTKRLAQFMVIAEEMGADLVLNACSSVREAADVGARLLSVPVAKIDTAMAEHAVATASRIGVAATVQTTLDPTVRLIEQTAREAGKTITVTRKLCEGAFDALLAGDGAKHDDIVARNLIELAESVDLIVLAQVSMGRVADSLGDKVAIPVLTSPRLGMERVAALMAALPERLPQAA